MKTSDPVRSTEEDRPAPETVSSRDTQKADETAAREKEPASPAAKEAPRERNPEEVRKPNVTVSLKDEISRHFEIIPYSLRENIIPLLNQCSTVHEIKILNDFFNLYLNLSRPEQIQLVHTLVRQIVVQGREVPAELIERLFAEEKGGQSQMPETRMPEGNVSETLPLIASEPKTQGEMPQKSGQSFQAAPRLSSASGDGFGPSTEGFRRNQESLDPDRFHSGQSETDGCLCEKDSIA